MDKVWTALVYIVVMAAVLVAAYLATRFLAKRGQRLKSRHIRLRDSIAVGRDKHLAVVEAGDKTLLIGITSQSINVLADIDPSALEEDSLAESGQRAAAKKAASFLTYLKEAPAELARARAEMKQSREGRKPGGDDEDYLSKMDKAIKRRINRNFDDSGRDE